MAWTGLAVLSGAAWGLCFRQQPDMILPWVALLPLACWSLRMGPPGRSAWLLGWLHGTCAWLLAIVWIAPTLWKFGPMPKLQGVVLLLVLALYLGSYHALFVALGRRLAARGGGALLLLLPALWVALEWLRTHLLSGFPWNLAGHALVEVPGALAASAWLGSYGLSYAVLVVNVALALALLRRRAIWAVAGMAPVALVLVVFGLLAAAAETIADAAPGARPLPVRIVQPNIDNQVGYDAALANRNYRGLLELSEPLCDAPSALLLWPESAAWPFSWERAAGLRADLQRLVEPGCGLLLNTPLWQNDGVVHNSVVLVEPGGLAGRYDKLHLVPYGEYVPLGELLPFVGHLARNAGEFSSGRDLALLDYRGERLGVSLCYEVVFPGEVAQRVAAGATILITLTNDAWYGDTAAPWQHLRAARFRAAENRRPLLRAAITGVSAIVDPWGRIEQQLGVGQRGVLRAELRGRRDRTLYTRAPWLVPGACAAATILAIGFAAVRRVRRAR